MLRPLCIAASMVMCSCSITNAATVVFDNTATSAGTVHVLLAPNEVNSLERANVITLGGFERMVSNLTVRMRIGGAGVATFHMQVRMYKLDGPGGRPGTPLWDSGFVPKLIDSGADISYSFAIPDVRVPNTFAYSVRVVNRQMNVNSVLGPAHYNPPTVGSAPFGFWNNSGFDIPDWAFHNVAEPPWGARVLATPIPGDVDHNAQVNVDDLVAVITNWGRCAACPGQACAADVNGDCQIDITDLAAVITNWG